MRHLIKLCLACDHGAGAEVARMQVSRDKNERLLKVFGDVARATIRCALVERRIHSPPKYNDKALILLY
jgi:hypothetical protein